MGLRKYDQVKLRVFFHRRNINTLLKSNQQLRAKRELVGHDFSLTLWHQIAGRGFTPNSREGVCIKEEVYIFAKKHKLEGLIDGKGVNLH